MADLRADDGDLVVHLSTAEKAEARRGDFGKDFAAVHGGGPAVVVELESAFGRLVVTTEEAASVAAAVARAAGRG